MAYNPNIPQPDDELSQSQGDILDNFVAIQQLIDLNHVSFGAVGQGKHKFVSFPLQNPAPTFDAGDEGLYNFLNVLTNKNQLYVHKQKFVGTAEIPMTASSLDQAAATNNSAGWSYLPSGQVLVWGTATGTGTATFTLPVTCPTLTAIQSVQLTSISAIGGDANASVRLVSIDSNSQITVYFSQRTVTGAAGGSALVLIIGA